MKKTVREIVELIASTYTLSTRSVNSDNFCQYNSNSGRHCAFAMMVKDTSILKPFEGKAARDVIQKLGENVLKDEFKGYPTEFYDAVQKLHDDVDFWTLEGLSEKGRERANEIIEFYGRLDTTAITV